MCIHCCYNRRAARMYHCYTYPRIRTQTNQIFKCGRTIRLKISMPNSTKRFTEVTNILAPCVRYSCQGDQRRGRHRDSSPVQTHTRKALRVTAILLLLLFCTYVARSSTYCKGIVSDNERCADAAVHISLMNFHRFYVKRRCSTRFHRTKGSKNNTPLPIWDLPTEFRSMFDIFSVHCAVVVR